MYQKLNQKWLNQSLVLIVPNNRIYAAVLGVRKYIVIN